jgi:hypothetical protein
MTMHENSKLVIGTGDYNNNPTWLQTQKTELSLLRRVNWEKKFAPRTISAILAFKGGNLRAFIIDGDVESALQPKCSGFSSPFQLVILNRRMFAR